MSRHLRRRESEALAEPGVADARSTRRVALAELEQRTQIMRRAAAPTITLPPRTPTRTCRRSTS